MPRLLLLALHLHNMLLRSFLQHIFFLLLAFLHELLHELLLHTVLIISSAVIIASIAVNSNRAETQLELFLEVGGLPSMP